jgi:hypothetical protein
MRDRDRDSGHEGQWACELDRPQTRSVERQANFAEERLRADGANLAEVRAAWASFDKDHPMEGDAVHRDFVRANQLAYARVVDDLMRQELGEGLRERHAQPPVDDEFAALLSPREQRAELAVAPKPIPAAPTAERMPDDLPGEPRAVPAVPGLQVQAPGERISDAERIAVQAAAAERIVRPTAPARPSDVRPEAWYLGRANALDVQARASVDREVARLKDLPQLSTQEAVAHAVARTAVDFERERASGGDHEKLRTRLYALAVVHDLRVREADERLREPPDGPTLPDLRVEPQPQRSPVETSRTEAARALPEPPTERDITAGSAPRVIRFVPRDDTDPRERDDGPTIPDERLPFATTVLPERDVRDVGGDDATQAGRKGALALPQGRERETIEISTRDIVVERDGGSERRSERELPDPTLNTRLSVAYRERSAAVRRELAQVAADADREHFSLARDAQHDPEAAQIVAAVAATVERIRSTPQSHDPVDLCSRVNELRERERTDPDVTDGRLRIERLAYATLARAAFERESQLLGSATREAIGEIQRLPDEERRAFVAEAAVVLREPAYNDRFAMNRELLREENPRITQLAALARTAPSIPELERQAKWREDASFHDRVAAEVASRLTSPERDDDLVRALAEARVQAALVRDLTERQSAHERAVELAEVLRRLPISRSLDLKTPAGAYRPLHR